MWHLGPYLLPIPSSLPLFLWASWFSYSSYFSFLIFFYSDIFAFDSNNNWLQSPKLWANISPFLKLQGFNPYSYKNGAVHADRYIPIGKLCASIANSKETLPAPYLPWFGLWSSQCMQAIYPGPYLWFSFPFFLFLPLSSSVFLSAVIFCLWLLRNIIHNYLALISYPTTLSLPWLFTACILWSVSLKRKIELNFYFWGPMAAGN